MRTRIFLLFIFLWPAILAISQNSTLTFTPQWLPQAQFAGYYVAQEQGFYRDAGLDVRIKHPSTTVSALRLLKNGEADVVSAFLMDGLAERLNGEPLCNIAQLSQHNSLLVVTKKESGIDKIEKLQNKKLAIWSSGFDKIPMTYFEQNNINVEFVRISNTINLFLMDGVDAMTVMYYNEYDQIINSGVNKDELNTFFFSDDKGFDIPEDGLYCLEETYAQRKEDLQKFVQATLKGWKYAEANKESTLDLVVQKMNEAHLPNNRAHQRWMLDRMLELISPGEKETEKGNLRPKDFHNALDILNNSLTKNTAIQELKYEAFFKPLFK